MNPDRLQQWSFCLGMAKTRAAVVGTWIPGQQLFVSVVAAAAAGEEQMNERPTDDCWLRDSADGWIQFFFLGCCVSLGQAQTTAESVCGIGIWRFE